VVVLVLVLVLVLDFVVVLVLDCSDTTLHASVGCQPNN
jgi:hypothetical protein